LRPSYAYGIGRREEHRMSTRATIHFQYQSREHEWVSEAIVYRHGDGYPGPDGLESDLSAFLNTVAKLDDTRFNDPAYLAAKWVVFDAARYVKMMMRLRKEKQHILSFLSIGIVREDPADIEYRYLVRCMGDIRPLVVIETVC